MNRLRLATILCLTSLLAAVAAAQQPPRAALTQAEEDRLRDAQEPSERIEVYLDLLDLRLARFEEARLQPADPQYDQESFLRELLADYILLNDELKNWIDQHYERMNDMRSGLRKLIERAPRHLWTLRGIQQQGGPLASGYAGALQDAIDQMNDTVDGATVALNEQTKKLGELKRQEKEDLKAAKLRAKEEARKSKEAKKERKRQDKKKTVPGDIEE
jgi:hypothetical protein